MARENKRRIRPYNRERIGSVPIHVNTLVKKDFDNRPSDLERDRNLADTVMDRKDDNPAFESEKEQVQKLSFLDTVEKLRRSKSIEETGNILASDINSRVDNSRYSRSLNKARNVSKALRRSRK